MMFVTDYFDIIKCESINVHDGFIQFQCRKWKRISANLLPCLIEVIHVEVRIAKRMNKRASLKTANLGHHVRQQCVRGNVEWNAKENICASLVELTIQLTIGDMELKESMTRHQCHLIQLTNVPC